MAAIKTRRSLYVGCWALLFAVGVFGFLNRRSPEWLAYRAYEPWVLAGVLLAVVGLALLVSPRKLRILATGLSIGLLGITAASELRYQYLKSTVLQSPTPEDRLWNERLIIGFDDPREVERLSQNGIAGIFLTSTNTSHFTRQTLRQWLAGLQRARQSAGLPELLVATDQEGAGVSRMARFIGRTPGLSHLLAEDYSAMAAYRLGFEKGRALKRLGVNVNFSPVVDVPVRSRPLAGDRYTRIETRAISQVPREVIEIAQPYVKGLERAGVRATLKHFPGLGHAVGDTHEQSVRLDRTPAQLATRDWQPFSVIGQVSNAMIMLSHVILSAVDPDDPVSVSQQVISSVIRGQLGLRNTLVTDDMTMAAIYDAGFCQMIRKSVRAGVDYVLISRDSSKYYDAILCLRDEARR